MMSVMCGSCRCSTLRLTALRADLFMVKNGQGSERETVLVDVANKIGM